MSISVVIPCYNHARFLPEAVFSVMNQELPVDEIIIVDDGSIDDTRKVALQLTQPGFVYYIRQENQGPSRARNTGLSKARGNLVGFLDADDKWHQSFSNVLSSCLNQDSKSVVVGCQQRLINEDSIVLKPSIPLPRIISLQSLLEHNAFPVSASLYNTKILGKLGGFDEDLIGVEDWEILLRINLLGHKINLIDSVLMDYRYISTSLSRNVDVMKLNALCMVDKIFDHPAMPEDQKILKARIQALRRLDASAGHIKQDQISRAREEFFELVRLFPPILIELHTYFVIICGTQPYPYHGTAYKLNLSQGEDNARLFLQSALSLFPEFKDSANAALSISLGRLAYQKDDMPQARRFFIEAARSDLRYAIKHGLPGNYFRTLMGRDSLSKLKRIIKS